MNAPLASSSTGHVTVGRQPGIALIGDRQHYANPGVIMVAGEAGIEKSRLIGRAATGATRPGYRVIQGRCSEEDASLPFAPLRARLRCPMIPSLTASQSLRRGSSASRSPLPT